MIEQLSPAEMKEAIANDRYCKELGVALFKSNRSRKWYLEVVDHGKLAIVKIPEISMKYGVIVHLTQSIEVDIKRVVFAGAELLERFNLTRGKSDNDDLLSLERNIAGVIGAKEGEISV
tara:strand:- start:3771 stop:4127 length:357 start_codon:yes stop_codon:yes gene_type:complete